MFFQEKKEELATWAIDKLHENYSRKALWRFFAVGFVGNVVSWLTPLLIPDFIADATGLAISIEGRIAMYLMVIPLSSAGLMAFSLIRIISPTKIPKRRKGDVFFSYIENSSQDRDRNIFLISIGCGAVNCIFLYFTVIWTRVAHIL